MPPAPERSRARPAILAPWQRPLVGLLLAGFALLAGGGLFLLTTDGASAAGAWALGLHIVGGLLVVPVLLAFSLPHAVVHLPRRPVIGLTGALVLLASLAVALTGAVLVFERSASPLRPGWVWGVHVLGGLGIVLLYALHRRWGTNPAPWSRIVLGAAVAVLVGGAFGAWERLGEPGHARAAEAARAAGGVEQPFLPSFATTRDGDLLPDSSIITDIASCGDCHAQIVEDWRRSAHRHASMTNPFYKGTIEAMRATYPLEDTRWCAACHDPALLFTGKMDDPDLDLDRDPDALVGLTCLSCHAIEGRSILGNGDYVLGERAVYAWEKSDDPRVRAAHDVLLRAKPDAHVRSMRPNDIGEASFCSLCHKAEVPPEVNRWTWFRAQDEYDGWHDSGVSLNNIRSFYHPPAARSCHDCHMPMVPAPADPSADAQGNVRSHLFAAANTALPFLRGDDDMIAQIRSTLRSACRVDVTAVVLEPEAPGAPRRLFAPAWRATPAVRPGEVVEAHVVVRNQGVGHPFPGGTIDSNEVWLAFEVAVEGDEPFYVSGALDEATGRVDPAAEFYRAWVADRDGERVVNRIGPDVYTRVYVKRIGPGTADAVRYRFRVPEGVAGTLRLRATLRYRKFMREYIDFLFPQGTVIEHRLDDGRVVEVDLADLPIVDMAAGELVLPISAAGTRGAGPDVADVAEPVDRDRINDLAIAYLLDEDSHAAEPLFEAVTRIDPAYADGWVNVARARIANADWPGARAALTEAKRVRPGFLKARFFEAEIARRLAEFAAAEQAYREVLAAWPQERAALRGLAQALYEQDRYQAAVGVLDRLFAIDPEDAQGWFWAVRVWGALGDETRRAAAEAAFDRFRGDDDEAYRRGAFLLADADLLRMEQKIHVHVAPEAAER